MICCVILQIAWLKPIFLLGDRWWNTHISAMKSALSRAEAYVSGVDYIIKSLPAFRSKNWQRKTISPDRPYPIKMILVWIVGCSTTLRYGWSIDHGPSRAVEQSSTIAVQPSRWRDEKGRLDAWHWTITPTISQHLGVFGGNGGPPKPMGFIGFTIVLP